MLHGRLAPVRAQALFDKLMEGIASEAGKIRIGPGLDPDTQMGPLVSEEQFTRVTGFLDRAAKKALVSLPVVNVSATPGTWWRRRC